MKNMHIQQPGLFATHKRQHGAILPLFFIGMLMILAMGGLALDMSHALLNKSRLQNTVDASALAGAEVLNQGSGLLADAEATARAMYGSNAAAAGNAEMATRVDPAGVIVEFSATLDPFVVGSSPAEYVRVRVETFSMPAWLIQLLGFNNKNVRASAVAGPSPTLGSACDIVPMIVCGDPSAGGPLWGYEQDDVTVLKGSSESGGNSSPIGPGNFQLARLGGSGADVVRENMAGGYEGCAVIGDDIPTEPGNEVGPVAQGLNTRLNDYSGPIKASDGYPPDVVVEQQGSELEYDPDTGAITLDNGSTVVNDAYDLDFNYSDYQARMAASNYDVPPTSGGAFNRRNLSVVIADCAGKNSGASDLPVLGMGCYFLLQEVIQKGNDAEVYGQFLESCDASGNAGPAPVDIPGPFKIQLYKDPDSTDS